MVRYIFFAFTVVLVLTAVLFSGCGKTDNSVIEENSAPVTILTDQMSVHEYTGDVVQSIAVISGTARNDSSQTVDSPSIQADYYDKNGKLLGSASATTATLAPGATWNFTIQFQNADAWKAVTYNLTVSGADIP